MIRLLTFMSLIALLSAAWPLVRLWHALRHTALRSACFWVLLTAAAWVLMLGVQLIPDVRDARWVGLFRLLVTSLLLAPVVAVLGARRPGAGAWNLIVLTLQLALAVPIFKQGLLVGRHVAERIAIDGPLLFIQALIALVGVVNYLPTRFGAAAVMFGAAASLQLVAIGPWNLQAENVETLQAFAGIFLGACAWGAFGLRRRERLQGFDGDWLRFRDAWGLVWSMRVRERWNAVARYRGWTPRLEWTGLKCNSAPPDLDAPDRAEALNQLQLLLRRFNAGSHHTPE